MTNEGYAILIRPLPESEGGGYVATVPDLPGCMSDGDTRQEAAENVQDAIHAWLATAHIEGRPIPEPGAGRAEMRQRLPRSLHAQLTELARSEGVSLNTYVVTLLAEAVGRREGFEEAAHR
ncbi:type II toxin-antitoxin system HicB family antitoxin [Caenispirillum salinarum]|uniref:type II toxin-antitoxin system HicB family antitoxin n=1 Tax=Caenispirillum salinarum TaxID=859058 RepID=UPI00385115EE